MAGRRAALLGLYLTLSTLGQVDAAITVLGVLVVAGGGWLAVRFGVERRLVDKRRVQADIEHGRLYRPANPNSPGHWVRTDFVGEIHQRVDARFRDARPHVAGDWDGVTQGIRDYWKDRLVALYGNAQVRPEAVNWLIRWHARRVAAQWRDGALFGYQRTLVRSTTMNVLFGLGIEIFALGVFILAGASGVGAAFLIGAGGGFGLVGINEVVAARRHDRLTRADNQQLYDEEMRAYHQWLMVLADRPSDGEMAQWLSLDVLYLKGAALRRCGLSNRDLVAHVVLTDGARKAARARVLHGPFRYSAYVVMVFLMTRGGVRQVEVDLDFLHGHVRDERRVSFRYDALASARVAEVGVRYANDGRYIVDTDDAGARFDGGQAVRSRAFVLSLLDGKNIKVIVENFDGLADPGEDPSRLLRMALDSSGIAGALHMLEAVAAEGREWISREHERRERRSAEWQDGYRGPGLLGPDLPGLFSGDDEP